MIGNIKETFPPKTGMQEKQLLQDPGYVDTVTDVTCEVKVEYSVTSRETKESYRQCY